MEKLTSKAKGYIRSHLRMAWRYYSLNRKAVKEETRNCPKCDKKLNQKSVKVDHIKPVGKFVFEDNPYIVKMFCDKDNLMGLCRPCHAVKTKSERKKKDAA